MGAFSAGHHGSRQVQRQCQPASLPVAGGHDPLCFQDSAGIIGHLSFLVESAGILRLLSGQFIDAKLSVGVLAHGHIQHYGAAVPRDPDAERIVADAHFIASPERHAAFRADPADPHEALLSCSVSVSAAPHPVGGVPQRHASDPVDLRQLHRPVRSEKRVGDADSQVPVDAFHRAPGRNDLGLRQRIHQAPLQIVDKTRDPVQSVTLHAVRAGSSVDLCADLRLVFRDAGLQHCLADRAFHFFIRDIQTHLLLLS